MTLYILNYNNYYNRLVKKFDTIEEYEPYIIHRIDNVNFNPNDGVDTFQTKIGNASNPYDGKGDYCIITEQMRVNIGTEDIPIYETIQSIKSRWFIIESVRTKGGQYDVQLHRDLVADYLDIIKNSPCFIEKANLLEEDPFIFNQEDMTFNQIKMNEYSLKDKTECAWVVGYYDPSVRHIKEQTGQDPEDGQYTYNEYDTSVNKTYTYQDIVESDEVVNKTYNTFLAEYNDGLFFSATPESMEIAADWLSQPSVLKTEVSYYIGENITPQSYRDTVPVTTTPSWNIRFINAGGNVPDEGTHNINTSFLPNDVSGYIQTFQNKLIADNHGAKRIYNELINGRYIDGLVNSDKLSFLLNLNNKIVRFATSTGFEYRRITIKNLGSASKATYVTSKSGLQTTISSTIGAQTVTTLGGIENTYLWGWPSVLVTGTRYEIQSQLLETTTYSVNFSTGRDVIDAGYGMFAIPYQKENSGVKIYNGPNSSGVIINTEFSLRFASYLATQFGSFLYDIQLLPYCPITSLWNSTRQRLDLDENTLMYNEIKDGQNNVVSYILFPDKCNFSFNIDSINIPQSKNKKIDAMTEFYRLISPNYNGQFEFNKEKNSGISGFNVDCTYKPYSPYIHVNPIFNGLYGNDWDDSRGLICSGDFSLEVITDQWIQYQINNKNYQNIFNRDIQNMDIQNQIARERDKFKMLTGGLSGALQGGMTAMKLSGGNPYASAAGALAGAGAGVIGAGLNYNWNETLRNEAIDYKIDQFGYSLGNVQALPQSISKTSALTWNNKLFPILEYFSCAKEEKVALANKIAYNGMTVMRIGKINEFINNPWSYYNDLKNETIYSENYIKGQLIRLEGLEDDFHISNAIASEINKGLFFKEVTNVN